MSRLRQVGGEAGVQPNVRCNDPQTVRPDNPHPVEAAPLLANLFFQIVPGRPRLAETRRQNDDPENPRFAALADQPRNGRGRSTDDRQIDRPGERADMWVRLNSLHRLALEVDGIDHAGKTGADQVAQDGPAHLRPFVAGTDHRDPLRLEDLVEIPDTHGCNSKISNGRSVAWRVKSTIDLSPPSQGGAGGVA